ncbi:GbsR/MarR family transcriptional regulator [Lysinimonas soli]|uniref:GbsR/MarR family transcriptional regulator n=1 Tax=Lysinimonas soli TaxID=1074233 RepID=A0ABW0NSW9_9MICO
MTTADESRKAAADFVATIGGDFAAQGFPRLPGFILMAITVSERGQLTAAELGAELGVSAAAISGAVRYLGVLGFIRTVTEPGSRRHVYTLGDTPWYTASLTSTGRYPQLVRSMRDAAARLGGRPSAQARVEELADFFEFLERRLPALLVEWNEELARRAPTKGRLRAAR